VILLIYYQSTLLRHYIILARFQSLHSAPRHDWRADTDAAGEWEMALKCGSLPRDAGDMTGLPQSQHGQRVQNN